MSLAVAAFAEDVTPAGRLAQTLGVGLQAIRRHDFPDGESLTTVPRGAETMLIYQRLDRPDPKLMPLFQACDAFRRARVRRLVLVAPYMPYLRQDAVFAPGQPVSRDVIGALLGARFDRIVTVDPHLHRTASLDPVFAPAAVEVVSAAPALAAALAPAHDVLVVGPDAESAPWARALAAELGTDHLVLEKRRSGDRAVALEVPLRAPIAGRRIVLVDDICSSGATLEAAVRRLRLAGASGIEIAVTHGLFSPATAKRLQASGASRIVTTDSCGHRPGCVGLERVLAAALREEITPAVSHG